MRLIRNIAFLISCIVIALLPSCRIGTGAGGLRGIPEDRLTVWKPGVTLNGGIPARDAYVTLQASDYGDGSIDASDAIQAAVDACPSGRAVLLSAGAFLVNDFILIDHAVTLRGAGTVQDLGSGGTLLRKTDGAVLDSYTAADSEPLVIIGPERWPHFDDPNSENLTADGEKGASSVRVSNGASFRAGQIVLLDEASGASWQPDREGRGGSVWASTDYRVVWKLHYPPDVGDDPLTPTVPTGGDAASWFCRRDRPTSELKEIRNVSGNEITFTTPLHIGYRVSNAAQLTPPLPSAEHIRNAGIEDLSMSGGADGSLRFMNAAYCWARNVEISLWLGEGIAVNQSFRVEARDSYIHDTAWPAPGGGGYAISLAGGSSEILFENDISVRANKVMVARCAGAGSVFGYNYVDQGYINYNGAWIECGLNASHMVGPHHVLFEGNYGFNWDSDDTHGNSISHTVFRNWLRGIRAPFVNSADGLTIDDATSPGNGPRRCAGAASYSSWMTFVGNVLGAKGEMSGWSYESTGIRGMMNPAIWLLGWEASPPQPYNPDTRDTVIRDGNFDWVTCSQRWDGLLGDPMTANKPYSIPDSLYLPSKPSFFGSLAWPWVDPWTGTVRRLPAMERFAAYSAE